MNTLIDELLGYLAVYTFHSTSLVISTACYRKLDYKFMGFIFLTSQIEHQCTALANFFEVHGLTWLHGFSPLLHNI